MTFDLPGFEILETLYESSRNIIFRASRLHDKKTVVLKTQVSEKPSIQQKLRLQSEYQLGRLISTEGAIAYLDLINHGNRLIAVEEDVQGISFEDWISEKGSFQIEDFLVTAIDCCKALQKIHSQNTIVKNISAGNILYIPTKMRICFIDFSGAENTSKDQDSIHFGSIEEKMLPFIAPEQTGRLNQEVDYRSDIYSLGIVFYLLVTGKFPIDAKTASDWLFFHLADNPVPPQKVNDQIPDMVAQIILKMIEKSPDNRYRSVRGLLLDLEECLKNFEDGKISEFKLGIHDITDRFFIPKKMYGRHAEFETILDGFSKIRNGGNEQIFVYGSSGVGKSSLLQKAQHYIVKGKGHFVGVKFEQFKRDYSDNAVIQIARSVLRIILSSEADVLERWKDKIRKELGSKVHLLVDAIPELQDFDVKVKDQVKSIDIRFDHAFKVLMQLLCNRENPVVAYLDDFQWVDSVSVRSLKKLVKKFQLKYFMLICLIRINDSEKDEYLDQTIEDLQSYQPGSKIIILHDLQKNELGRLIQDTLNATATECEEIVDFIYDKTKGNVFFTRIILQSLYDEGLIYFRNLNAPNLRRKGLHSSWSWDAEKIKNFYCADNAVGFLASRFKKFDWEVKTLLKIASCLGYYMDAELMEVACELEQDLFYKTTQQLINYGLISTNGNGFLFAHDRIQEAAYTMMRPKEKRELHKTIGLRLLKVKSDFNFHEWDYEIITQFNYSYPSLEDEHKLVWLNLTLSTLKKEFHDFNTSNLKSKSQYAIKYIDESLWEAQKENCTEIFHKLLLMNVRIENVKLARKIFDVAYPHLKGDKQKSEFLVEKFRIEMLRGTASNAENSLMTVLELNNIDSSGMLVDEQFKEIDEYLRNKAFWELDKYPVCENEYAKNTQTLLARIIPVLWNKNYELYEVLLTRSMYQLIKYGIVEESPLILVHYAYLQNEKSDHYVEGLNLAKSAITLAKEKASIDFRLEIEMMMAIFISLKCERIEHVHLYLDNAYELSQKASLTPVAHKILFYKSYLNLMIGESSNLIYESLDFYHGVIGVHDQENFLLVNNLKIFLEEIGAAKESSMHVLGISNESEYIKVLKSFKNKNLYLSYFVLKMKNLLMHGNTNDALVIGAELKKKWKNFEKNIMYYDFLFLNTLAFAFQSTGKAKQKKLDEGLEVFNELSINCPENYSHKLTFLNAVRKKVNDGFEASYDDFREAMELCSHHQFFMDFILFERFFHYLLHDGEDRRDFNQYTEKSQILCYQYGLENKLFR